MNIIFLDFDGVLNSTRSAVANLYKHSHHTSFRDREWAELDPIAIGLVDKLCKEAPAKVVISSTWRMNNNAEEFNKRFKAAGCKYIEVCGVTPVTSTGPRGREIDIYLSDNTWIKNYVIIDDDSDMLPSQQDHFVHTPYSNGLLIQHYHQALKILNPKHPSGTSIFISY